MTFTNTRAAAAICAALAVLFMTRAARAESCTYESRDAAAMGLPTALVGSTVSVAHCLGDDLVAFDRMHAALQLGSAPAIAVAGLFAAPGACLSSRERAEVWPGFAPDLQVSLCRRADGSWTPRVNGRLPLAGVALPLVDADVEHLAGRLGPVRLRLPRLALGLFALEGATVTTAFTQGALHPSRLEGTLRWNGTGPALAVAGDVVDGAVELDVGLATAPPDFPFPGVALPPLAATLRLDDGEWRFFIRAEGTAALGPLGPVALTGTELEVRFRAGQWAMAGCLAATATDRDLGALRFDTLSVAICGLRTGVEVHVGGRATLPMLGITGATVDGTLRWASGAWAMDLGVTSRVALGPFASVGLTGTLAVSGPPGALTISGCLRGDGALASIAGLTADLHVAVGRCTAAATSPAIAIDGRLTLPGGSPMTVAGTLTVAGSAWLVTADVGNAALGPFGFARASVSIDSASGASFAGDLDVGPFALRASGRVAAAGPFALDVGLRAPATLPGGLTITDAAGSRLAWDGSAWRLALAAGLRVDAGGFGLLDVRGALDASWDPTAGAFDLTGCVGAAVPDLPLDGLTAEVCFADQGLALRVRGRLGGTELVGALITTAAGPIFDLGVAAGGALPLAAGVSLSDAHVTIAPGATRADVRGRLCTSGLCVDVSGQWNPAGRSTLTASLAAGAPWRPFASLPALAFTGGLTGTVIVEGGAVTLDVRADSTLAIALAPGLTLERAFARAHFVGGSAPAAWSVALGGATTLALAGDSVTVTVEGSLDAAGRWTLTGASTGRFDPLAALIGAGRFVIAAPGFTVSVPAAGAPAITLTATMELCLLGSCAPGAALTGFVRGGLVGGATPGVWFVARVPNLALPGFGALDAALAVTSTRLTGFDLLDTPTVTADDVTVEPGLTVSAMVDLPVRFGPQPPRARLTAYVGDLLHMSLAAALDLQVPLVRPEHNLPGIASVSLDSIALVGSITAGVPAIGVRAQASFLPSNQANPLTGTAALSMSATGDLGVDLSLAGRWYQPFGLPKIAIQNPAFALSVNVGSSLPIPSRIGFNGDFFWLKTGTTWPTVEQWPLPVYGQDNPVPAGIMALGGTFYFDAIPSPSGLCPGVCIPLPALIVRFTLHDLGVPDLVKLAGDVKTGVKNVVLGIAPVEHRAALATLFPDGAFAAPVPSPFDVTINDLELYLSTHNLSAWGLPFTAGFRAVTDVSVSGRRAILRGVLDDQGLLLDGRLPPITLFGLSLTGDPTRRIAQLGATGTIAVADDARLTPAGAGTVEGHLLAPAGGGTIASKLLGLRGYKLRVKPAVRTCGADGTGCRDLLPIEVTLGDGVRTAITTTAPVVPVGEWHHVAATWSAGVVRVYLDGAGVPAPAAVAVSPVNAATALALGAGLTYLDDVRLWNVARTAADLARDAGSLPPTAFADTRLIARYAFDFDRAGTPAYNQRLLPAAPALHATYGGGAVAIADPRDQDLFARLRLALPGAGASGFTAQAGASLTIPALGGVRAIAASLAIGDGEARGQMLMPEAPLLSLPSFGALVVGGRGPNLVAGDFDDGAYGAFDLRDQSLAASAGLYFRPTTGARQTVFDGSLAWTCPTGRTCTATTGRRLLIEGTTAWSTTLPGGAPMSLSGAGRYDSDTGELAVDGALAVFGQTLTAGASRITPSAITLRSTLDLSAIAPVALGPSTAIDLSLAYAPARLCGNGMSSVSLPGTATRVTGTLGVCLGASPSLAFSGTLPSLTVAGITMSNVAVTYTDAAGLRVAGDVALPGVFTGRMAGAWTSATQFQLDASASLSLAGFAMTGATLRLTPTGFRATGTLDLGLWSGATTVAVSASGAYTVSQTADLTIAGFTLDNATLTLTNTGLQVAGQLRFLTNLVSISGAYHSDGAYRWSTTATVRLGGFSLPSTTVTLARYTTAHPRTLSSWPLSGLRVDGTLAMLGGTLDVTTAIDPITGFSITASPALDVLGYPLTSTSVTLSSASGLSVRGNVKVGSTYLQVSGAVPSLTAFTLCSASNLAANAAAGLPDLRGRFCLERDGAAATLTGDGKATFWGVDFATSFRIATTGGIDYLFIDVAVARFELLGVSATGRMKLKVQDNDLTYVRWYGRLYIANPIPGWDPILDFDSYVNLSAFRLCPSQFGIDPTAFGLPSGCVSLTF